VNLTYDGPWPVIDPEYTLTLLRATRINHICETEDFRLRAVESDHPMEGVSVTMPAEHSPHAFRAGVWCAELDLSGEALHAIAARQPEHATARILVRLHSLTLGYLTIDLHNDGGTPSVEAVRAQALSRWSDAIAAHLREEFGDGAAPVAPNAALPSAGPSCPAVLASDQLISVVICTHNRAALLAGCLDRVQAISYPDVEILIVDNAPSDSTTRDLVTARAAHDERLRYVAEPRKGLSTARNAGLRAAAGLIIAYTDDDVEVDTSWLAGLARGFLRDPNVRCTTGLVCAADVSNEYEAYFDAKTSQWSTRTDAVLFGPEQTPDAGPLYPYAAGVFGTGANMAFDRATLLQLGGFDEALGAGTHTRGGEDLDMFARIILAGFSLAYEPHAVVWHHHRATAASSAAQMLGYGSGLTAYVTKLLLSNQTRGDVLRRLVPGLGRLVSVNRGTTGNRTGPAVATTGPDDDPRAAHPSVAPVAVPSGLVSRERVGYLYGPLAYARSRFSHKSPTHRGAQV
jgi:GT2 family glycosyltransferase